MLEQIMNLPVIEKILVNFIKETMNKNGFQNAIVGVSGGIDSALVLTLLQRALGSEHTFALIMPYKSSAKDGIQDAKDICEQLQIQYQEIDITPSVDSYFDRFPIDKIPNDGRILIGNKCARERMSILYDFSSRKKALVAGTSNKSELLIGYTTQFGDSAAAFLPIGDLYKTQVFLLARYLNIPEKIIARKPSADLWPNQTDEGEIGLTYKELDEILYRWVDLRMKPEEIEKVGHSREKINRIISMVKSSHFKRTMAQVCKLHPRTVGIDFRYPRDWNK